MPKSERPRKAGSHRSAGRRLTVEQQQEYRSRGQFDDRFSEYGWVVNSRERDHGEDISIDIYDEGRSVGLSFLAQLKSTEAMPRLLLKS